MRQIQRDLHQQLRAESIATRERIAAMVRPLDAATLNEHPEPEGWSIAQVLEHLCRSAEAYEQPLAALFRQSRQDAGAPTREWKSSFVGGLIAGALLKPRATRTRPVFDPGPTPRNGVVDAMLAGEQAYLKTMDDAAAYDWRALRLGSPALPSWAPKMNLGDAFRIHVVHVTRHSRQIERLLKRMQSA